MEKIRRKIKPWRNHFLNFRNRHGRNTCLAEGKLSRWEKTLWRRKTRKVSLTDNVGEFISGGRNSFFKF